MKIILQFLLELYRVYLSTSSVCAVQVVGEYDKHDIKLVVVFCLT